MLVGIDEVGRGCLAGPVCVAAVALADSSFDTVDSKQLTAEKREAAASHIRRIATQIGIGWASHAEIDAHGMTAALKLAAQRALAPFGDAPELILLDGNTNYIDDPRVATFIKGDERVPLIGAASIIAKVARDAYMHAAGQRFPGYGFEQHVGYATAMHRSMIVEHGPCALHRMSFAPLKGMAGVN